MIDPLELKLYRSAIVSDGSTNGGRMGNTEVVSAAAANLFPVTSESERQAGTLKYRKAFLKVANDNDETLANPKIFLDRFTPGADIITFFPGSQIDTQATITGSENQYGAGKLDASVLAGVSQITVLVEAAATVIFRNGERIRISDKTAVDAVGGNEEFLTITGTPSFVGNVATINLTTALQNGYAAADTYVSSLYEPVDIEPTISDFLVTSAGSGDYDPGFLSGDSIGGIEQTWTATFTSGTAFNVSGDTVGAVAAGSVGAGSSPANPAFTKPYYVLAAGGFSGVWASGDTIVFKTHPAAAPIWAKRVVPAASAVAPSNNAVLALKGETA